MAFKPKYLLLHDYGGQPKNEDGVFNPYHVLVFPDGSVRYRYPDDPYGRQAPHAYKMNPESLGLSYAGEVGSKPTSKGLESLKSEFEKIKKLFPDLKVFSHGEAYNNTKDMHNQASKLGRGLDEAGWRTIVRDGQGTLIPSDAVHASPSNAQTGPSGGGNILDLSGNFSSSEKNNSGINSTQEIIKSLRPSDSQHRLLSINSNFKPPDNLGDALGQIGAKMLDNTILQRDQLSKIASGMLSAPSDGPISNSRSGPLATSQVPSQQGSPSIPSGPVGGGLLGVPPKSQPSTTSSGPAPHLAPDSILNAQSAPKPPPTSGTMPTAGAAGATATGALSGVDSQPLPSPNKFGPLGGGETPNDLIMKSLDPMKLMAPNPMKATSMKSNKFPLLNLF